jgi:hypothetical protein
LQEDEDPFGVMEEIEELIDNALEVLKTFAMITSYLAAIDALNLLGKPTAFSLEFAAIELLYSGLLVSLRNHASENVARMDSKHTALSSLSVDTVANLWNRVPARSLVRYSGPKDQTRRQDRYPGIVPLGMPI